MRQSTSPQSKKHLQPPPCVDTEDVLETNGLSDFLFARVSDFGLESPSINALPHQISTGTSAFDLCTESVTALEKQVQ